MAKMKGKVAIPFFEELKKIDRETKCEYQFEWLFLPKENERLCIENKVLNALLTDCIKNKGNFLTKKKDCICADNIYTNDSKIKGISRKLEFDFYLPNFNIAIEFDESQHFTHERGVTFAQYPANGFSYDIERWKKLCEMKKNDPDPPCRDWKRAFRDAVRDIRARENRLPLIRVYEKDFNEKAFKDSSTIELLKDLLDEYKK